MHNLSLGMAPPNKSVYSPVRPPFTKPPAKQITIKQNSSTAWMIIQVVPKADKSVIIAVNGLKETDVSFFFLAPSLPPLLPPQRNLVSEHYFQVIWSLWTLSSKRALVYLRCICMNSLWAERCTALSQGAVNRQSQLEVKTSVKRFLDLKGKSLNYSSLAWTFSIERFIHFFFLTAHADSSGQASLIYVGKIAQYTI